jgi:hypothetical protein
MTLQEAPMSSVVDADAIAGDGETTVFRAYERAEFLEWPAWRRLQKILGSNGGSYGLSGPRGAGKTWLMLRAIEWIQAGEDRRRPPGIGLWYPSPSEYDSLAFLASLSESLATRIERWYRRSPTVQSRLSISRVVVANAAIAGFFLAFLLVQAGPWKGRGPWVLLTLGLAGALGAGVIAYFGILAWRSLWSEQRLLREAHVLRERARYSATRRQSSEVGGEGGRGVIARVRRISERQLVERPATLSSLVNDFRALAAEAAKVTGGVVVAIDELDKMSEPEGVRELLRDIKAIFEVPHVHFLVSVSDEAARDLSLGALIERNEFNSSFYTVVRAQPATPADCAELLERRGNVPREVSLALAVLAGGNPREVVRLAELAGPVTTGVEAAMSALGEEALALRRQVVTATSVEGKPELDLGQAARERAFLALPDEAFERPEEFTKLCASALENNMWNPPWADPGWTARFEEAWRRLMVRLAVAGQLAAADSIVRDTDLTDRLLDVVATGGQSSQVAKIVLDRNLRIEKRSIPTDRVTQHEVRDELGRLARRYESTRQGMDPGQTRTRAMDDIARDMRRLAAEAAFTTDEIRKMLRSQQAGDRVVGLAAVQALADPETFSDVLKAVEEPNKPFEQYHALRALESIRSDLDSQAKSQVVEVLTNPDWRAALGQDSSRLKLADRILTWLQQEKSSAP